MFVRIVANKTLVANITKYNKMVTNKALAANDIWDALFWEVVCTVSDIIGLIF